jgi:hypothetical protein
VPWTFALNATTTRMVRSVYVSDGLPRRVWIGAYRVRWPTRRSVSVRMLIT